ncbi:MAG: NAD+ synthase [Chloroflexota bacterium]|nr:NAD+ synthase [Chloroflexota bacterium]
MTQPQAATPELPYELPDELLIDTAMARRIVAEFIRGHLRQTGFQRALVGLSGGIDSALVAYLTAEAIGADRLLCLLLPYRTSSPASQADAEEVVRRLGCRSRLVDISPIVDGYFHAADPGREASNMRRGNFSARARMAVLYDESVVWGGLVMGTSNKTESLLGYTTIFGDNAAALLPIGDLYKSQVRQLSAAMGVAQQILHKPPTADLWAGQTDEEEIGLPYAELDRLLYWVVDRRRSHAELRTMGFEPAKIERVERLVAASEYKRQTPPIAKLAPRTPGVDYLYPRRRPVPARER